MKALHCTNSIEMNFIYEDTQCSFVAEYVWLGVIDIRSIFVLVTVMPINVNTIYITYFRNVTERNCILAKSPLVTVISTCKQHSIQQYSTAVPQPSQSILKLTHKSLLFKLLHTQQETELHIT